MGGNMFRWARSAVTTTSSSLGSPRHVHVYRDGKLVLKWNVDAWVPMKGRASAQLIKMLADLRKEGAL